MKKYFLAITVTILFTQGVYSQAPLDGTFSKSDREQMNDIDKIVRVIKSNLKNYIKTGEVNDSTDNRYSYKDDKKLMLLTVYSKDENIDKNVEWYFHNGQLIYSQKVWTDPGTKQIIQNEKVYLNNDPIFC